MESQLSNRNESTRKIPLKKTKSKSYSSHPLAPIKLREPILKNKQFFLTQGLINDFDDKTMVTYNNNNEDNNYNSKLLKYPNYENQNITNEGVKVLSEALSKLKNLSSLDLNLDRL